MQVQNFAQILNTRAIFDNTFKNTPSCEKQSNVVTLDYASFGRSTVNLYNPRRLHQISLGMAHLSYFRLGASLEQRSKPCPRRRPC